MAFQTYLNFKISPPNCPKASIRFLFSFFIILENTRLLVCLSGLLHKSRQAKQVGRAYGTRNYFLGYTIAQILHKVFKEQVEEKYQVLIFLEEAREFLKT